MNGQKIQNRGTTRYHSKPTTESRSSSVSTTRSPRNKNPRAETDSDLTKHETHLARESSNKTRVKSPNGPAVPSRTNASRHANLSNDNARNRSKSHTPQSQAPKKDITRDRQDDNKENVPDVSQAPKRQAASRRASMEASTVWVDDTKLDLEVFTKSPGHSRSRTGRKIYANLNAKESRNETVTPRKSLTESEVKKMESPKNKSEKEETRMEHPRVIEDVVPKANESRMTDVKETNSSSSHKDEARERDILLSGSESVRVDIPLTVGNGEDANSNLLAISSVNVSSRQTPRPIKEKVEGNDIARSSAKKSRHSDRSKSRGRSNVNDPNFDVINFSSPSRRGTSKFGSTAETIAETNGRSSNSRHRSGGKSTRTKSRSRSAHKSKDTAKGRNRAADIDFETNGRTEKRRSSSDRRTSEGKRRSNDSRSKAVEIRTNDQDARAQARGRSRSANGSGKFNPEIVI